MLLRRCPEFALGRKVHDGHGPTLIALGRSTCTCRAPVRSSVTPLDQALGVAHFERPPHPLQAQRQRQEAMPPPCPVFAQRRSRSAGRIPRLFRSANLLPEERSELPRPAPHLHRICPPRTRGASPELWHSGSLHGDARSNHGRRWRRGTSASRGPASREYLSREGDSASRSHAGNDAAPVRASCSFHGSRTSYGSGSGSRRCLSFASWLHLSDLVYSQ